MYGIFHTGESHYVNGKCRDPECKREATRHRKRRREERAAKLQADPSLQPHGNVNTYAEWGCRCNDCTAANSAKQEEYRRKRKEKS